MLNAVDVPEPMVLIRGLHRAELGTLASNSGWKTHLQLVCVSNPMFLWPDAEAMAGFP